MRKTYIDNNDYSSFFEYMEKLQLQPLGSTTIKTQNALGRVTSRAIFAKVCDPTYNAAAMDGIAVVSESTKMASDKQPLFLKLNEDFVYVNTGNAITGKYNAVIMIEDVLIHSYEEVSILAPATPWQHIRVKGESIVEGEIILPANRKIRPTDIGAAIAGGNLRVSVLKQPIVGIIPTGNEMVDDPRDLTIGKLMESNSKMFSACVKEAGGIAKCYPTVADKEESLVEVLKKAAAECNLVIVNAGSSAGTKDFAASAIASLGSVMYHGFAIKPGKPTILGEISKKPVIGIPGYPVSAYLVFESFVKPILERMTNITKTPERVEATLSRRIVSSFKNLEIIRMALGEVDGKLVATPLERGASQIMSLVKADGLLRIDRLREGIEQGEKVQIELKKPLPYIKKTLVVTGSHDMLLDILQDKLPLTSCHVGSLGGLAALKRGECHIAPCHILDESGGYNVPIVSKYFHGKKMAIIRGVARIQGLMKRKDNNKVSSIFDLAADGVSFANRQRGSGTRILLDFELARLGIDSNRIDGYTKEYNTHLAVAVAVENGIADAGLGVLSAAKAVGLEFIPVAEEQYDFVTTADRLEDERVKSFIKLLKSRDFLKKLDKIGGYSTENIGQIIMVE